MTIIKLTTRYPRTKNLIKQRVYTLTDKLRSFNTINPVKLEEAKFNERMFLQEKLSNFFLLLVG